MSWVTGGPIKVGDILRVNLVRTLEHADYILNSMHIATRLHATAYRRDQTVYLVYTPTNKSKER